MNNNRNKGLEEEFRSSQLYRFLTGTPAGSEVADGIGKAARTVDQALGSSGQQPPRSSAVPPRQQTPGYPYPYAYPPQQASRSAPQQQPPARSAPHAVRTGATAPQQQRPAPQPNPQPQGKPMKLVYEGSKAKYYITAAAALLYAANLPLYEPVHFVLFGLVIAGAFALSSKLFKGKKKLVPVDDAEQQESKKKEKKKEEPKEPQKAEPVSSTGDAEVDKIIEEGKSYLKRLRAANDAIPDEALSEDIDRMERASADIFAYIADHPKKAPQIRKFMNYYLPTTLKLLASYQRLSSQSAKGENIRSTMFNIAGMMHTVADAFEKQLDSLFTDEAMDVSADISVFETLLKQEGFVEEGAVLKQKPKPETPGEISQSAK